MLTILRPNFADVTGGSSTTATTAKEAAIASPSTPFQQTTTEQEKQANNRDNLVKIVGAAVLLWLGFTLLEKGG